MKKAAVILVLIFLFINMPLAVNAEAVISDEANYLNSNGILLGNNGDLMLDKYFTVEELMTILSRLTGEEEIAKNYTKHTSFTDVPKNRWSEPFIAWAENRALLKGIGNGKSGYLDRVTAQRLLAFILRILDYNDVEWKDVYNFARTLGLMDIITVSPNEELTRGQMCKIVYRALETSMKNSVKLGEKLGLKVPTGSELEPSIISSVVSPAVFYIEVKNSNNVSYGSGSGFIVNSSGVVVTNYHVIDGAYAATIRLVDGRTYPVEKVLSYDKNRDVAVLKITGSNLPQVKLGNSDRVKNGDKILTIGSPQGLENTISDGLVSNRDRLVNNMSYIQISAPISHGSSGGVLLNYKAEVIGITTAYYEGGQNLNLAIPVNALKPYLSTNLNITLGELVKQNSRLKAPANVRTRVINTEIQVGWDKVEGADGYYIYYSDSIEGPYKKLRNVDGNDGYKFSWYSADYQAFYACIISDNIQYIKVSAIKNGDESDCSQVISAVIPKVRYYPDISDVPQPVAIDYSRKTFSTDGDIVNYFFDSLDLESYVYYLKSCGFTIYKIINDSAFSMSRGSTIIVISDYGNQIMVSGVVD